MSDSIKENRPGRHWITLLAGGALVASSVSVPGETTTGLVGFSEIVCRGGSDTLVSVAFQRKPVFRGPLAAAASVNGGKATLNLGAGASLPPGELAGTHYVRFRAGSPLQGRTYPVTTNTVDSVTVDRRGDPFAGVAQGAGIELVPMWTLESLLPRATQQTLHVSGGNLRPARRSELLVFDPGAGGENVVPSRAYFMTSLGWREVRRGYPLAGDTLIPPGTVMIVRHRDGDGDTAFRTSGRTISGVWVTPLPSRAGNAREIPAGIPIADDLSLDELQLENGNGFVDSVDTSPEGRRDEVRVYSGDGGTNPGPSAVFFRTGGRWHEDAAGFPEAGGAVIPAGAAIKILKAPRNQAGSRWVFDTGF